MTSWLLKDGGKRWGLELKLAFAKWYKETKSGKEVGFSISEHTKVRFISRISVL